MMVDWIVFFCYYKVEMKVVDVVYVLDFLVVMLYYSDISVGCYCEDEVYCYCKVLCELLVVWGVMLVD